MPFSNTCRVKKSTIAPAVFQEEYRDFLCKCGVEFDERYVWD